MPLSAGIRLGPYEIRSPLGAGGMGEVYHARDPRLDRDVALKVLPTDALRDAAARARLLREARLAASLNHPHICTIYEVSESGGQVYIAMELITGRPLNELIPSDGLPDETLIRYGIQIADALGHAHDRGVVHRDLKGANVLITPEGRAKVLDFGIATRHQEEQADATRSVTLDSPCVVAGTLPYMAPEVLRGALADARSDVWALGVVLYEMASGRRPFRAQARVELTSAILRDTPAPLPPSRTSGALTAIVQKCLSKDPSQRYRNGTEARTALEAIASVAKSSRIEVSASTPSIAVLPFVNMSRDQESEYFGDGLAEDLINALTQIGELRVTARTSAFSFHGKSIDVREIGRTLNVGAVLEGSVRRAGNRLRITAQLVKVTDGYHLWSERYDREMTDVFEIQDEISQAIVEKLRPRLLGEALPAIPVVAAKRHTEDPEAYSLYLKGRYCWNKHAGDQYRRAIDYFEQAVSRDPRYALAHAGLADAYNTLGGWEAGVLSPEEAYRKSRFHAEKALQLDSGLAEGHIALGYALLHFGWNIPVAERCFTDAIRLNPRSAAARHWYSHLLIAAERFDESLAESLAYVNLDPADPLSSAHLTWHHLMAHEFDKALTNGRRALEAEPNFAWNHTFYGWALLHSGAFAEASVEMARAADLIGKQLVILGAMAHAHAVSGRREEAGRLLDQLSDISKHQYMAPYAIGMIHEALGNTDEAFRCWERAYDERSPWLVYLACEPRLRHLRGQPRFDALVARVRRHLREQPERS